ncbi:MAG: hypothetical protein EXQ52_03520 [Bryobacterales bacterium]|nr:hypothetical protein [Bryobacterales bacterium]
MNEKLIRAAELAEMRAWEDLYRAAPGGFRATHALKAEHVGGALVLTSAGLPLAHFNSAIGLGTQTPAGEESVEAVLACFAAARASKFYVQTIAETQYALEQQLRRRGLRVASGEVEEVTSATSAEWAGFIDAAYRLTTSPWLRALVDRPRWHHYVLREQGVIAACRSMFVDESDCAWFGIDAPVPGIMTGRYDCDLQLCAAMVEEGLGRGVSRFVADIERPAEDRTGPAYDGFRSVGFEVPYLRHNFMPGAA